MGFHLSLPVRSLRESEDFHVRVLGAHVTHRDPSGYINIELRGVQLTLKENPDAVVPGNDLHFGFNLDAGEFDALVDRAQEIAPNAIEGPPYTVDAGTSMERRKLYLRCPSGYRIELKCLNVSRQHVRLWKYHVADEHVDAFVRHYSMDGSWVQLFRETEGYVGTQLWQDENDTDIFYTADYWRDRQAFDGFNANYRERYEQLDRDLEFLTLEETFLGAGTVPSSGGSNK